MRTITMRILIATIGGALLAAGSFGIALFTKANIIMGIILIIMGSFLIYKGRYW